MQTRLQQPREALPTKQKHPPKFVGRVARLEKEQVVQLAHPLVHAPAESAQGDDVERFGGRRLLVELVLLLSLLEVVLPHVGDGFGEVGAFLFGDVEDLRGLDPARGGGGRGRGRS